MALGDSIIFQEQAGVAWVTLNRPRVLNAYNVQMRDELFEALGLIESDPAIRVAIFRGAGDRAFCAGADLTEFGTTPSQAIARRVRFERDVWDRFLSLRKPLIAAIHGYCLGSGLEIALFCDIRIASLDARFGLPETGLGMIPAAGGTQTLPRAIGAGRAAQMLLTGETLTAEDAFRIRLVNRLTPKETLFQDAEKLAAEIALLRPEAVSAVKDVLLRGMDTDLDRGCGNELMAALAMASLDNRV